MCFWIPLLSVFLVEPLLPERLWMFIGLVCFLSVLAVLLFLRIEGNMRGRTKVIWGLVGWIVCFAMMIGWMKIRLSS